MCMMSHVDDLSDIVFQENNESSLPARKCLKYLEEMFCVESGLLKTDHDSHSFILTSLWSLHVTPVCDVNKGIAK